MDNASEYRLVPAFLAVALCLSLAGHPAFAAETHEMRPTLDGPIYDLDALFGETRIEALDAHRIAVAVDRNDAFAVADSGVDYYAVFTAKTPFTQEPSFWGQATVDLREGMLLVAPAGEARLFAFLVEGDDASTRHDVAAEFPTANLITFGEGASLLYRKAPAGMALSQLEAVAREASVSALDHLFQQTEGDDGSGGCARSCSMTCYDGSECDITCGSGLCASCSCEDGTLSCKCS